MIDTAPSKLTRKEQIFVNALPKHKWVGSKAIREAYNVTSSDSARAIASQKLRLPRINEAIQKQLEELDIDNVGKREIAGKIGLIAFNDDQKTENQLKALELLAKINALMIDRAQVETSEKEYRAGDLGKVGTNDLLSELTERLKLSNQGIDTSKPKAKLDEKPISEHKNES